MPVVNAVRGYTPGRVRDFFLGDWFLGLSHSLTLYLRPEWLSEAYENFVPVAFNSKSLEDLEDSVGNCVHVWYGDVSNAMPALSDALGDSFLYD